MKLIPFSDTEFVVTDNKYNVIYDSSNVMKKIIKDTPLNFYEVVSSPSNYAIPQYRINMKGVKTEIKNHYDIIFKKCNNFEEMFEKFPEFFI